MNETVTSPMELGTTDPSGSLLVFLFLLFLLFLCGLSLGVAMNRPSNTQARIQHRAYKAFLQSDGGLDETVAVVVRRHIKRLERRLHIDDDDTDD